MKRFLHLLSISCILTFLVNNANAQWGATDTISFEVPRTEIAILPLTGNLWQIGVPQKLFFSSSYSPTKAIMTDTINGYLPNDTSTFIYTIHNPYTQTCATCLDFWHKYDMDSIGDKGIVEASYDGGVSWVVVKDTSLFNWGVSWFYWNSDIHASNGNYTQHNLIINGKSDGWIKSEFCWQWFIPVKKDTIVANPDSLMIRFTFISDSIVKNKDGWMIDDIVVNAADWSQCSGITENSKIENFTVYPNPFTDYTSIEFENKNSENYSLEIFNNLGQKVRTIEEIRTNKILIERGNLNSGIYFFYLKYDSGIRQTGKLILE